MTIRTHALRGARALLCGLAASALSSAAVAEPAVVGHVAAIRGQVQAEGPGGSRTLSCGDAVYAGDSVTTGVDSTVGIAAQDAYAQLDSNATVEAGLTDQGAADLELRKGRIRVIDRLEGENHRLGAIGSQARVHGNDAEAYVLAEKVGPYPMFCEWDEPLPVSRGQETLLAPPGTCAIAKPNEPIYGAPAHDERLPIDGAGCPTDVVMGGPGDHFTPTDVAAPPPPGFAPPLPGPPLLPPASPCDDPGSGCTASKPLGVIEQPPIDTGF